MAEVLEFQHQSFQLIFRIDRLVWSPCSPRDSQKSLHQHHSSETSILWCSGFFWSNSHIHKWLLEKTIALTIQTFMGKVMFLLFNTLSRFIIAFLPRSKCLLISWLQSPSEVILESKKIKSLTVSIVSPSIYHEVMGPDAMILAFWMLSFKSAFSLSSFTLLCHFHQETLQFLFVFYHKGGIICISEGIDISPSSLYSSLCFIQHSIFMMFST